ncbi:hypothetical protein ACVI1K_000019 [Bradyrhizobium sp. USDA 4508]
MQVRSCFAWLRQAYFLPLKREANEGYILTSEGVRNVGGDGFTVGQNKEALASTILGIVVNHDLPDCGVERLALTA